MDASGISIYKPGETLLDWLPLLGLLFWQRTHKGHWAGQIEITFPKTSTEIRYMKLKPCQNNTEEMDHWMGIRGGFQRFYLGSRKIGRVSPHLGQEQAITSIISHKQTRGVCRQSSESLPYDIKNNWSTLWAPYKQQQEEQLQWIPEFNSPQGWGAVSLHPEVFTGWYEVKCTWCPLEPDQARLRCTDLQGGMANPTTTQAH